MKPGNEPIDEELPELRFQKQSAMTRASGAGLQEIPRTKTVTTITKHYLGGVTIATTTTDHELRRMPRTSITLTRGETRELARWLLKELHK